MKENLKEKENKMSLSVLVLESVRWRYKSIKDHAHYNVDKGILELSTKYKKLRNNQTKQFLITMIHEIHHAINSKKYGWKKFKEMWEYEANMITGKHRPGKTNPYKDNPYEIEAEEFGQKHWNGWYKQFKKEGLI